MKIILLWAVIFFAGLLASSFFLKPQEKIIYKCPKGQVRILENAGTDMEAERCYTPGVNYTDYRPMTTKEIK